MTLESQILDQITDNFNFLDKEIKDALDEVTIEEMEADFHNLFLRSTKILNNVKVLLDTLSVIEEK